MALHVVKPSVPVEGACHFGAGGKLRRSAVIGRLYGMDDVFSVFLHVDDCEFSVRGFDRSRVTALSAAFGEKCCPVKCQCKLTGCFI